MADKQGFVYILTNPSFKDDWVKIGKSSRSVDVLNLMIQKNIYNSII